MEATRSVNGIPIRLTEERWEHIVSNKPYMEPYREKTMEAVENPTWILRGYAGALVAVLSLGKERFLHVVYRETSAADGFILTAFIGRKVNRRQALWPKKP